MESSSSTVLTSTFGGSSSSATSASPPSPAFEVEAAAAAAAAPEKNELEAPAPEPKVEVVFPKLNPDFLSFVVVVELCDEDPEPPNVNPDVPPDTLDDDPKENPAVSVLGLLLASPGVADPNEKPDDDSSFFLEVSTEVDEGAPPPPKENPLVVGSVFVAGSDPNLTKVSDFVAAAAADDFGFPKTAPRSGFSVKHSFRGELALKGDEVQFGYFSFNCFRCLS